MSWQKESIAVPGIQKIEAFLAEALAISEFSAVGKEAEHVPVGCRDFAFLAVDVEHSA